MKHIPKQEWMGCAVASAAMVADLSYDEVAAHWPDLDAARLRGAKDLCNLLESVTEIRWKLSQCWRPMKAVHEFPFPDWPVAVFINDAALRPRFGQWIVVRGEIVHDPGHSSAHIVSRYPLRDWVVTWITQPVRPNELARSQVRNRLRAVRNTLLPLLTADYRLPPEAGGRSRAPCWLPGGLGGFRSDEPA
jgi:hypothetical protein